MALTSSNRLILSRKVPDYQKRMKLEEALERGNVDDIVLEEILHILDYQELLNKYDSLSRDFEDYKEDRRRDIE